MGIAALVLGIISIVLALPLGWIAIVVGVVGIILGALAKKKENTGIAKAGLICSIVGTAIAALIYISCFICVKAVQNKIGDIDPDAIKKFEKEFKKELKKELEKK